MNYYYLVSSLPQLVFGDTPPTSMDGFLMNVQGVLTDEHLCDLRLLVEGRSGEAFSPAVSAWHATSTQIRNAIVRGRASASGTDPKNALRDHAGFSVYVDKEVADALAKGNPLEREMALDRARWNAVSQLMLDDAFGFGFVVGYAVRLQIAERWSQLSDEVGARYVDDFIDENTKQLKDML